MTFVSLAFQYSKGYVWKVWRSLTYSSKKTQVWYAVVIPYVRVKQFSWKNISKGKGYSAAETSDNKAQT